MRGFDSLAVLYIVLVITSIAMPVVGRVQPPEENILLYEKTWFGMTWRFYDDKVVVVYKNETLVFENHLSAKKLVSYNLFIQDNVTYKYVVQVGRRTITAYNMFLFSMTGTVKIRTIIESDTRIPPGQAKKFFYRVYLSGVEEKHRVRGKHLFFDWRDIVEKARLKPSISRGTSYIDVSVSFSGNRLDIDPVIGVIEGNMSTDVVIEYTWFKNYIVNPGFEDGLSNWTVVVDSSGYTSITADNTTFHTGSYSAKIYSTYAYGDTRLQQQFSSENIYIKGVRLYAYIVNPGNLANSIIIYSYDSSVGGYVVEATISIPTGTLNTWVKVEQNFTSPTPATTIEIHIQESVGDGFEVYIDDVEVFAYTNYSYTVKADGYYWAYSDSNATYKFSFTYSFLGDSINQKAKIIVPKGYEVLNISVNNLLSNYTEEPLNTTHKYVVVPLSNTTCNVVAYFTAWNSITDLVTDYTYYPYGSTVTVTARLLDPYLNPISGENITLWVGGQYKLNQTTLTITAYITGGTIIAPHLYNWYLDGQDDYIVLEGTNTVDHPLKPSTGYAEAMFKAYNTSTVANVFRAGFYGYVIWFSYGINTHRVYRAYYNGTSWAWTYVQLDYASNIEGQWHVSGLYFNNTSLVGYLDYVQKGIAYPPDASYYVHYDSNPIYIGREVGGYFFKGYITYTLLATNYIDTSSRIVQGSQLLFLMDPTFYNGTHYFDLVNNVAGVPYGGVQRVEAGEKWLWVVVDGANDNYVHLRYFPVGSIVRFIDPSTGAVVREVFIAKNDEIVSLPAGNYTVEAIIADGYYQEYVVTTDANGYATITFTAPNQDAEITIQAQYNGTYTGVKNKTIYSSGIAFTTNISSLPNPIIMNKTYVVSGTAWMTVDNSPANIEINFSLTSFVFTPTVEQWNATLVFTIHAYKDLVSTAQTITITRDIGDMLGSYTLVFTATGGVELQYTTLYNKIAGRYTNVTRDGDYLVFSSPDHVLDKPVMRLYAPEIPIWLGSVKAFADNKTFSYSVDLTNKKIVFNVTGPCTLRVWVGELGKPDYVYYDGQPTNAWVWDDVNKVVEVPVTGTIVELVYQSAFEVATGGGGGILPSGNLGAEAPAMPTTNTELARTGLVIIALAVIGLMAYKEINKPISEMWQSRLKKMREEIKWRKTRKWWE